jgi:hypothetical protein
MPLAWREFYDGQTDDEVRLASIVAVRRRQVAATVLTCVNTVRFLQKLVKPWPVTDENSSTCRPDSAASLLDLGGAR